MLMMRMELFSKMRTLIEKEVSQPVQLRITLMDLSKKSNNNLRKTQMKKMKHMLNL